MGVFGTGLYSGDFAMDLRSTISAVSRLPFASDKLADILCENEPKAANAPGDEGYSTFWLVIADQFAKRSIVCDRVRDNALEIIDSGADIAAHGKLGMNPSDLRKRQKKLIELRGRISAPAVDRGPRPVLKKPQALLMDVGDIFAYPTFGGRCINAYAASRELDRRGTGTPPWKQDGWAAIVIVDRAAGGVGIRESGPINALGFADALGRKVGKTAKWPRIGAWNVAVTPRKGTAGFCCFSRSVRG